MDLIKTEIEGAFIIKPKIRILRNTRLGKEKVMPEWEDGLRRMLNGYN